MDGIGENEQLLRLHLRWGSLSVTLQMSMVDTMEDLRNLIYEETGVRPVNQKIFGLKYNGKATNIPDETFIGQLNAVDGKVIKMMGSVDSTIDSIESMDFETVMNRENILDDLDWDHIPTSESSVYMDAARDALMKTTAKTKIHVMNAPRSGRKLLVLDLDHTLLDFSSRHTGSMEDLKRPFMDQFLTTVYRHYDLVVWSQTKWHWVEIKLTEMGIISNPSYSIAFAMDRSSMFKVQRDYKGEVKKHEVKALDIIWSKFPQWSAKNTVHIDDLARNFVLNPQSGLQCSCYKRKRRDASSDSELVEIAAYLELIGSQETDFTVLDHNNWRNYLQRAIDKKT